MNQQLQTCPVCSGPLHVSEYRCPDCRVSITGDFRPSLDRLGRLPPEDREFVVKFIRSRGSIREMEKLLGVSYTTVRGMLDRVIERLGYEAKSKEAESQRRIDVLQRLDQGEITAAQAVSMLRGEMSNGREDENPADA